MDSFEEKVCVFMDEHSTYPNGYWSENSSDSEFDDSNPIERTSYWEAQLALLQDILERHHLTGSKLREEVGQIMEKVKATNFCNCLKPNSSDCICTHCLRRRVATLLCDKGFNTNLRKSKWRTTKKIPAGSHEYLEVTASTSTRKKQIPFLIELEFRDQFQIAKAGEEYQKLVSCLPEFYIGKAEYLTAIVQVMCNAAKKSMKEKKMHLGPWRKSSFMQMKWSGFNQTWTSNKSSGRASQSNMSFSGAPNAVKVN